MADDRARPYKSRTKRPCDFCRQKRAACLLDSAPPCQLCARYGKPCTFVQSPTKRRRLLDHASPDSQAIPFDQGPVDPPASSPSADEGAAASGPFSLDAEAGHTAQIVGLSGESDPYLLRSYHFDAKDECSFQQLRIRNMGMSEGLPVQFMIQDNSLACKAQPGELGKSVAGLREDMVGMVGDEVGARLIRLFFRYVQPYFPVLSRERTLRDLDCRPESISTCLLAAIYGHALPFCVFDDKLCVDVYTPPHPDTLFQLAWHAVLPEFHTPSLAVVQTLLLLVQRRPTNKHVADTPFKSTMMAEVVALAQALGLNIDPTDWPIPLWERRLRRRLAWAVYVQDRWLSLNFGRSSHIHTEDWDVGPLSEEDFGSSYPPGESTVCEHFLHLASLTEIVAQIQSNLFSLKATRTLSKSLEATFDAAKPLRISLAEWFQARPSVAAQPSHTTIPQDLDGNGSLRLAYITAKICIFRALLRPQTSEASAEARSALRAGAMAVAREMYDFLASLEAHHLEAFWHSYSRVNFAIASNFMVLLFASSPTPSDATESLALLNKWRYLLRIKSRSCDLLNLCLLRLDAMYVAGLDQLVELSPNASQAVRSQ